MNSTKSWFCDRYVYVYGNDKVRDHCHNAKE